MGWERKLIIFVIIILGGVEIAGNEPLNWRRMKSLRLIAVFIYFRVWRAVWEGVGLKVYKKAY